MGGVLEKRLAAIKDFVCAVMRKNARGNYLPNEISFSVKFLDRILYAGNSFCRRFAMALGFFFFFLAMIIRKIIKHGGALAVTIPAAWLRDLDMRRGDYVYLECGTAGIIMMRKLSAAEVEVVKPKEIQYGKEN